MCRIEPIADAEMAKLEDDIAWYVSTLHPEIGRLAAKGAASWIIERVFSSLDLSLRPAEQSRQ